MTYTTNYQLPQWVKSDRILMDDFNDANQKLDTALKSQADSLASHAAQLLTRGNCTIQLSSYTGNGGSGEASPTVVNFPSRPAFFIAAGTRGLLLATGDDTSQAWRIVTNAYGTGFSTISFAWNGSQARFWGDNYLLQLNEPDVLYRVVAFYAED